ncbi:hypothetical protein AYX14_00072 [Cryptococcus neoformans]|nr:hypothetical protein AYX14_00072 [Cryptococcus neoformans var. grubii]
MSGIANKLEDKVEKTFFSGGPGTTGREPFEDSATSGTTGTHSTNTTNPATSLHGGITHDENVRSGMGATGTPDRTTGSTGSYTGTGVGNENIPAPHSSSTSTNVPGTHTGGGAPIGAQGTRFGQTGEQHGVGGVAAGGVTGSGNPTHAGYGSGATSGLDTSRHGQGIGSGYGAHESSFAPPISSTTGAGAKVADYGTGSHTSSHHTGAAGTGAATAGAGAGAAALGHHENKHTGSGHTGSHSHDTSGNHGVGTSDSYGSGIPSALDKNRSTAGAGARDSRDRTGHLEEGAALYERSTDRGPVTGGAANTDKFDTDKPRNTSGLTGHGTGKSHNYDGTTSRTAPHSGTEDPNKQQSGGAAGIFATSDKDFTSNTDRIGKGAYHDDQGLFKDNTSGPGGRSALTGREGNYERNPISGEEGAGQKRHTGAVGGAAHEAGKAENKLAGGHSTTGAYDTPSSSHGIAGRDGTTTTTGQSGYGTGDRTGTYNETGTTGTHTSSTGESGTAVGGHDTSTGRTSEGTHEKKGIIEKIKEAIH